jgi:tRNA modification GTPase
LIVVNKIDKIDEKDYQIDTEKYPVIEISAKQKTGIEQLTKQLTSLVNKGELNTNDIIVSNARHYQALNEALQSILQVEEGIATDLSTDLMTIDIRAALHSLGEITGEISTDDLLDNIFRNFCIGK